jgi:hypothetical protein
MKKLLLCLTVALPLLVLAAPAKADKLQMYRAIAKTKNFARQTCNSDPDCTSYGWGCRRKSRYQAGCIASIYYENLGFQCTIGLVWYLEPNGVLVLVHSGKPQCFNL